MALIDQAVKMAAADNLERIVRKHAPTAEQEESLRDAACRVFLCQRQGSPTNLAVETAPSEEGNCRRCIFAQDLRTNADNPKAEPPRSSRTRRPPMTFQNLDSRRSPH